MILEEDEAFLEHFGVKGMKWGVRRDRGSGVPGVSRKTDRDAKKDANEFARAKMFYGQGAGTRRKLINATVEAKRKKDPAYGKAFDAHLSKQDMSKQATKARGERKRTDRKDNTKKRAGYLARRATGEMGTQAAFTALVVGGVAFSRSPKGRQIMKSTMDKAKDAAKNKRTQRLVKDFINKAQF